MTAFEAVPTEQMMTENARPDAATGGLPRAAGTEDIYRLLGFATMSGEDPLRMWARLKETSEWLVGPLSPDAWAGQVFIADHADIFAFRFLPLPSEWMKGVKADRRLTYAVTNFEQW